MKRKDFLKLSLASVGVLAGGTVPFLSSCMPENTMATGHPVSVTEGNFTTPLTMPPTTGNSSMTLAAQEVSMPLPGFGTINGFGYQAGSILGPSIRVQSGQNVSITLSNTLSEATNIHWHGLKVPATMDGHPDNSISQGKSTSYSFTIAQRAGLYWYHPHAEGTTAKQVFQGLAGLMVVNDSEESALNLPYGLRELFLVIQDKRIASGRFTYTPSMMEQMTGYMGEYILVNGLYAPYQDVTTAQYRVRVLNGSNARIYNLALSNNAKFTVIGNDGGLLPRPVEVRSLILGPGERADLIVDFSTLAPYSEIYLVSKGFDGGTSQGQQEFKIMKFTITTTGNDTFSMPSSLSAIAPLTEAMATSSRSFDIANTHSMNSSSGMMQHTINGNVYDSQRIDVTVTRGTVEKWTFDNSNGKEPHPMHVHGVLFQILSRTGGREALSPLEAGWKDTVLCMPGEKVSVLIPFDGFTGKFLYHCHNLEHEESGMMAQYKAV